MKSKAPRPVPRDGSDRLIHQIRRRYEAERPVPSGETWVCGASGGADSTALVHVLSELSPGWELRLVIAHLDHGLRGAESEADARFVADLAARLGHPCHLGRARDLPTPPPELSPEARARRQRRRFLADVRRAVGADRVALAHTLDDQAETVLLRAMVGTSIAGLGGMDPAADARWVRPLLRCRRAELRRWLRARGHSWREDSSNRTTGPLRNRVRREILPLVHHRLNPRAAAALARLADDARAVDRFVDALARDAYDDCATEALDDDTLDLDRAGLASQDPILRRRVIRHAFARLSGTLQDLSHAHICEIEALASRCGELHLPGHITVSSEHGRLRFRRTAGSRTAIAPPAPTCLGWDDLEPSDVVVRVGRSQISVGVRSGSPPPADEASPDAVAVFDAEQLHMPILVRAWQAGDRFTPFGMEGRVKLSDLFGNAKIPRSDRAKVPIVADEQGILWVAGVRRSNRAPVGPNTERVVRVKVLSF